MTDEAINIELVYIALERVGGHHFERFFQGFYPAIAGEQFVGLGGMHDGGADGFQETPIHEGKTTGFFYQASKELDYRAKIRRTVKRLRGFGRNPTSLVYVTASRVKHIDVEEAYLSQELKVTVRIRDAGYIATNINHSIGTRAAYHTYLQPNLEFLRHVGTARTIKSSKYVETPAIYVFLRQELDRRQGKRSLVNALADGLILWSLEGTDPEEGKFLTQKEIIDRIEAAVPAARTILRGILPTRLRVLAKTPKGFGRPIRWYRSQGKFCLSYELRKQLERDNAEDESLRIAVLDTFETRLADYCGDTLPPEKRHLAAQISLSALQQTFESEGLELAAFIEGKTEQLMFTTIADHVDTCLLEQNVKQEDFASLKEAVLRNLQGALCESTMEERLLFSKLSATYTLLFCLNTEPRLIEYFQKMAAGFDLFVGTDVIVKALGERYLHPEDRRVRNTLRVIREAGGKLILTEPVFEEVWSHIEASDYEFRNNYQQIEPFMNQVMARNIDRPLVRAYFLAKLMAPTGITGPTTWSSFINQCCEYEILHRPEGGELLRHYLLHEFQMKYELREDIDRLCDPSEVRELAQRLLQIKSDERLAHNDALMALAVYGQRRQNKEYSNVSEFGYRTWWLTWESRILQYSGDLVAKYKARYMMRPEFILSFLSLIPSAAEVRQTYRTIFPTLFGIQLARRTSSEELGAVLGKVREALELEPARRAAEISRLSDMLKSDFTKRYDQTFAEEPREEDDLDLHISRRW